MVVSGRIVVYVGIPLIIALAAAVAYWPASQGEVARVVDSPETPRQPEGATPGAERQALDQPARSAFASRADRVRVVVRCVDSVGGHGIEGVVTSILTWPIDLGPEERSDGLASHFGGITDHEGYFAAKELPEEDLWAELRLDKDGYVPLRTNPLRIGRDPYELGDVRMARGVRITGRVTDGEGAQVQGCELTLGPFAFRQSSSTGIDLFTRTAAYSCESNESGEFEFPTAVGPGTWSVGVDPEFILVSPRRLRFESSSNPVRLSVVVARPPRGKFLEGVIQNQEGAGIAGVRVAVSEADQAGQEVSGSALTDDAGFFLLEIKGLGLDVMRLVVSPSTNEYQNRIVPGPFRVGEGAIRVVLERTRSISLVVVHAHSGEPLTEFRVVADPSLSGAFRSEIESDHHPEGRLEIKGLTEPVYRVFVIPSKLELSMAGPILVRPGGTTKEILVKVEDAQAELSFEIVSATGSPIHGAKIRLFEERSNSLDGVDPLIITRSQVHMIPMLKRRGYGILVGSADSGVDGRAILKSNSSGPPSRIMVEVVHPDHAGVRILLSRLERSGSTFVVTLSGGAKLTGRIRGLPDQPAGAALDKSLQGIVTALHGRLANEGIGVRYHDRTVDAHGLHAGRVASIDETGSFELRGLPPGRCDVLLIRRLPGTKPTNPAHEIEIVSGALLVTGQTTNVESVYAGVMSNPVDIGFSCEGHPIVGRRLWVYRLLNDGREHPDPVVQGVSTDAAGSVNFQLPVGNYRLALASPQSNGSRVLCEPPIHVIEGRGFRGSREVVANRMRLRILSNSDNALTRNRRMVIRLGEAYTCEVVTNRDAECEVFPGPPLDRGFKITPAFCWSLDHKLLRGLKGLSETAVQSIATAGHRWVGTQTFGPFRAGTQDVVEIRLEGLLK